MEHINELLSKSLNIATEAHKGQFDKGGNDYILHPIEVSSLVDEPHQKILGLLHDVVEDTPFSLEVLKAKGFPSVTLSCLNMLTRKEGETYHEYILRISLSTDCTAVKLADISCNMNLSRLSVVRNHDLKRLSKYTYFSEVLKRKIFTDTDFKCVIPFTSSLNEAIYYFSFEPSNGLFTVHSVDGEDTILLLGSSFTHEQLSKMISEYQFLYLF